MPSNQENIEAKLAAYVDGELSGADREEIERHLTANPQHRKLMSELMQTSAMLKDVPRALAPADVLDSLQSQLERSALLGRPEELSGDPSYKIGFWTQFRAIAAILILTIGLATVVYFVLPRSAPNIELATKDAPPIVVEEQAKPDAAVRSTSPAPMEMHAKSAGPMGVPGELHKESAAVAAKGGFSLDAKAQDNDVDPVPADIRRQLAMNGVRDDATFIVVDTANAPLANATVSNYLNYNRATWEQMPISQGLEVDHLLPSPAQALTNAGQVADELQRGAAKHAPPQQNLNSANSAVSNAMEQQAVSQSQAGFPGSQIDLSQTVPTQHLQQSPMQNLSGNLIVARSLNRTQVAELNGLLNQQSVGTVSNFARRQQGQMAIPHLPAGIPAANAAPAGQADARLKIGDTVRFTLHDQAMVASTMTTAVDAAGNLNLSDVGDVPAVGLTLTELNQLLSAKYRDAHIEKPVPVAGELVDSAGDGGKEVAVAQDAMKDAGMAPAQNAAPVEDQPTDVVIIVRETARVGQSQVAPPAAPRITEVPAAVPQTTEVPAAVPVNEPPATAPATLPATAPATQP